MTPDHAVSPPRRADAERNRAKILAAARDAFADPGTEVSMAEISRRAGVGMATLYRNFPGRRDLLEALYLEEVSAGCAAAEAASGQSPGAALLDWLRLFLAFVPSKRLIVAELLADSERGNPVIASGRARTIAAGQPLLAAAQEAREIRRDLTLEQILDLISAIARIQGDPAYLEPILRAALDGLRPPPGETAS